MPKPDIDEVILEVEEARRIAMDRLGELTRWIEKARGRPGEILGIGGIGVSRSLAGLRDRERDPGGGDPRPVDRALPVRNVDACEHAGRGCPSWRRRPHPERVHDDRHREEAEGGSPVQSHPVRVGRPAVGL